VILESSEIAYTSLHAPLQDGDTIRLDDRQFYVLGTDTEPGRLKLTIREIQGRASVDRPGPDNQLKALIRNVPVLAADQSKFVLPVRYCPQIDDVLTVLEGFTLLVGKPFLVTGVDITGELTGVKVNPFRC
jgi:hypothetical protein